MRYEVMPVVTENSVNKQYAKILEEVVEIYNAAVVCDNIYEVAEETCDVMIACATLLSCIERDYKLDTQSIMHDVVKKNRKRGYYIE